MSKKANPPPPVPVRGAVALLVLGLAESALALFQWSQLLTLRRGGTTVTAATAHAAKYIDFVRSKDSAAIFRKYGFVPLK